MKKQVTSPLPDVLGGRFMVAICGLITENDNKYTTKNLNELFKITRNYRETAIRHIHGCILTAREDQEESGYDEEGFTRMKEVLAEYIDRHWGVTITPKQLEPKPQEWENTEDLTLGFNVAKLPKAKRSRQKEIEVETVTVEEIMAEEKHSADTPPDEDVWVPDTPELSFEERLERGDFDV